MLNQIILVGRLKNEIEWIDNENATFELAIPRNYKNEDGEYDTDIVKIYMTGNIATNTAEYCKKGDIVGIKGHIESLNGEMKILAEKNTFLSSHKPEEE